MDGRVSGSLAEGEFDPVGHLLKIVGLNLREVLDYNVSLMVLEDLHLFFLVEKVLTLSRVYLKETQEKLVSLVALVSYLKNLLDRLIKHSLHGKGLPGSSLAVGQNSYIVSKEETSNRVFYLSLVDGLC